MGSFDEQRPAEAHAVAREQRDVGRGAGGRHRGRIAGQPAAADERGCGGDVEKTSRSRVEFLRAAENEVRPGVNANAAAGATVEPADITQRIVETHQGLHAVDGGEGGTDGAFRLGRGRRGGADLDERAEQRAGATEFSGGF